MPSRFYPQWRDLNAVLSYPFEDGATLLDNSGVLLLSNDWLVDAAVYSPIAIGVVHVSRVVVDGAIATVFLLDGERQLLGTGLIDRFSSNPIAVLDGDGQPVATLVPSDTANSPIFAVGDGDFSFLATATSFVASCILHSPFATVSGFRTDADVLAGSNLVLVGERGIQLTVEDAGEIDAAGQLVPVKLIRAHAVGDPQSLTRDCLDPARRPTRFVRELVFQYGNMTHVCQPDSLGNVVLIAESSSVDDSSLRIQVLPSELRIELLGRSV